MLDEDIQKITVIDRRDYTRLNREGLKYFIKENKDVFSKDYFNGYLECLFQHELIGLETLQAMGKYIYRQYKDKGDL